MLYRYFWEDKQDTQNKHTMLSHNRLLVHAC